MSKCHNRVFIYSFIQQDVYESLSEPRMAVGVSGHRASSGCRQPLLPSATDAPAPTSWRPATAGLHHSSNPAARSLTGQRLLISAQISSSWNWVPFRKVHHVEKGLRCKNNAIYQWRQGDAWKMIDFPDVAGVYHRLIFTAPCAGWLQP